MYILLAILLIAGDFLHIQTRRSAFDDHYESPALKEFFWTKQSSSNNQNLSKRLEEIDHVNIALKLISETFYVPESDLRVSRKFTDRYGLSHIYLNRLLNAIEVHSC